LNQLTKLGKPFKYIVTCVIMQKNGAGFTQLAHVFGTTPQTVAVLYDGKTKPCTV